MPLLMLNSILISLAFFLPSFLLSFALICLKKLLSYSQYGIGRTEVGQCLTLLLVCFNRSIVLLDPIYLAE